MVILIVIVAVFFHRVHQYHVASALQAHSEYSIAKQRVAYNADRTVDEAPLLVEVPRET